MGTKLALRAGQLAADTKFMTAKYTEVFTIARSAGQQGFPLISLVVALRRRWLLSVSGCAPTSQRI